MPDWFTHSLVGWITGKTTKQDIVLVVIGSLIPDLVKINLVFLWLELNDYPFFESLHTPIGACLIAGFRLSEIRRALTDFMQQDRFNAIKKRIKNIDILLPATLGIMILLITLPAHLNTPLLQDDH